MDTGWRGGFADDLGIRNCFKSELVQKCQQSLASVPKSKTQNKRFQIRNIESSNEFLKIISDMKLVNSRRSEYLIYEEFSIEKAIEHRRGYATALKWK